MRIQIATFAGVPEHLYDAERNFRAEKVILILSTENMDENNSQNKEFISNINEVSQFYEKLDISVLKVYVNYKDFMEMTTKLINVLRAFQDGDEVLLNLSGGRRAMPIALIYAGTFISNFRDINIKCVVIPEDRTYKPFDLLPSYLPDTTDIKLMSKLSEKKALTDLENFLGIKQPTISMRLQRLEKHGYIIMNGRERKLTDLGSMVVSVNIGEINDNKGGK